MCEEYDQGERRQPSEYVDEVGAGEAQAAGEPRAQADVLGEDGWDRETEEREPNEPGEDEECGEERKRDEDEDADQVGPERTSRSEWRARDECCGGDVAERDQDS